MISRFRNQAPFLVLVAGVLVLFHRLLLGEVIFWGTPLLQFYPWREMVFSMMRDGVLPLWNPLAGHGAPLLANYQTAVFYPPNWLYFVMSTEHAMGWVGVLHVIWAGAGMMAYLRRLGVDRLGQGIGALAFSLSGFVIARFGFLSVTSAVAWLPWLLWAVDGLIQSRFESRIRRTITLAIITAALLLAGHAQTTFYSLLFAGLHALWSVAATTLLKQMKLRLSSALKPLALALGAVALGVGIAAIQLVPTFEYMQLSQRSAGPPAEVALSYSFWPWHTLNFIMPGLFGSPALGTYWGYGAFWEDAVYIGLLPLALVIRAFFRWRQDTRRQSTRGLSFVPFFVVLLIPVFVFALGWNTPIFPWLFEHAPTFNLFNSPARWMLLGVFSLSALSGLGADRWSPLDEHTGWPERATALGLAFLVVTLAAQVYLGDTARPGFMRALLHLGAAATAYGGLAILLRPASQSSQWRARWEILLMGTLAADLLIAGWGLNPTTEPTLYQQRAELADSVPAGTRTLYLPDDEYTAKFDILFSMEDYQADDAAHWQAVRGSLLPNLGMLDDVPSASNDDPLLVGAHAALLDAVDDASPGIALDSIQRMNVGMLLSSTTTPLPGVELDTLGISGAVTAYEIPEPWPRVFVADCEDEDTTLQCTPREDGEHAAIAIDASNRLAVEVTASELGWLVLIDTYYPGWRATVNGTPAPIERANAAFRAVSIPAGEHRVTFTYRPTSIVIGAIVTAISLVGLVVLAWLARVSNGRHEVSTASPMKEVGRLHG